MEKTLQQRIEIQELLQPENALEEKVLQQPGFVEGLMWGKPRFGHPEGKVLFHVREVLDNIDRLSLSCQQRTDLRLTAYIHDTFKHLEDKSIVPRDWSKHHAVYARHFAQSYIQDPSLLNLIELHDEAYYSWRSSYQYNQKELGDQRLAKLLSKVKDDLQMYYLFFKCDTRTGDKDQAPLEWFEGTISGIDIVDF